MRERVDDGGASLGGRLRGLGVCKRGSGSCHLAAPPKRKRDRPVDDPRDQQSGCDGGPDLGFDQLESEHVCLAASELSMAGRFDGSEYVKCFAAVQAPRLGSAITASQVAKAVPRSLIAPRLCRRDERG